MRAPMCVSRVAASLLAGLLFVAVPAFAEEETTEGMETEQQDQEVAPAEPFQAEEEETLLEPAGAQAPARERPSTVDEITVTGSYLRGESERGPSPVDVVDRPSIEAVPAARLTEVVDRLPYNVGAEFRSDQFQGVGGGTAFMNLRGLGPGQTLVLLDGKRLSLAGALSRGGQSFYNIAQIPGIMVQNIDILKEGAAAVYGSDAVAGVVNFKLRRDFDGFEFKSDLGDDTFESSGYGQQNFEALFGRGNDRTHFTLSAGYFHQDKMRAGQRRFTRAKFNTSTGNSQFGNPGSYFNFAGAPVAIDPDFAGQVDPADFFTIGDVLISDPDCEEGGGVLVANIPGATSNQTRCAYSFAPFFDLTNETYRWNGYATFDHEFNENAELFADALYFRSEDDHVGLSPSFPILNFGRNAIVPAENPGNFLGIPLIYFGRPVAALSNGLPIRSEGGGQLLIQRYLVGLKGLVPGFMEDLLPGSDWSYEADVYWARERGHVRAPDQIADRWNLALGGLGGPNCDPATGTAGAGDCFYWNPFGNAITNPTGTGNGGLPLGNRIDVYRWFTHSLTTDTTTTLGVAEWLVKGDLAELDAGPVGAAFGMQWREETYDVARDPLSTLQPGETADTFTFLAGGTTFDSDQDVFAVFSELDIPVTDTVDFNIAARFEDYGGSIESSLDPKAALQWSPLDWLSFRTSASTTFRAPTLNQQLSERTELIPLTDVQVTATGGTTGAFGFKQLSLKGNSDLQPEEAVTFNFGMITSPFEGLNIIADYYRIRFNDIIVAESGTTLLANENEINVAKGARFVDGVCAPGLDPNTPGCFYSDPRIQRTAAGEVDRIFTSFQNASRVVTDGIDLTMTYDIPLGGMGDVRLGFTGSHIIQYDVRSDPDLGFKGDAAGSSNEQNFIRRSLPKYRFNVDAMWFGEQNRAAVQWRHISPYDDDRPLTESGSATKISQFNTWDASFTHTFQRHDVEATLAVENMFDQDPPYVLRDLNYDSRTHDPFGRRFWLRFKYNFSE